MFNVSPCTSRFTSARIDYSITARKRSWGKVMFLQASVILLTGGPASVHAGIPPPDQAPPWTRHPLGGDPPGRDPPRTRAPRRRPPGTRPPSSRMRPPRHRACWEIRSTRGRYASYWNASLLCSNSMLRVRSQRAKAKIFFDV